MQIDKQMPQINEGEQVKWVNTLDYKKQIETIIAVCSIIVKY